jgi:hypothetical protein
VDGVAHPQPHWLIQPLIEAGLDLEEIRTLVFRLGFDVLVGRDGTAGLAGVVTDPVTDRPPEVQAAWAEMIGRMLHDPAGRALG